MQKLTVVLDKFSLSSVVLGGLENLVGDEKALEIWQTLKTNWRFTVNHRVVGRTGQCRYPGYRKSVGEIEINGVLLGEGRETTRNNTILHEVAHAVNRMIFDTNDSHGPNWKRIMRAFGLRPERCNTDVEVSAVLRAKKISKSKLMYKCQRCEHEFPAMRRKKYPANLYTHKRCGGKLYLQRDAAGRRYLNPSKPVSYGIAS